MAEPAPALPPPKDDSAAEIGRLQAEKVRLEIDVLRRSRRREWLTASLPLLSAVIAVAGVSITANQFFAQQNRDRLERAEQQRVRDEAQIRTDLEQLLGTSKDKAASARVVMVFEDLGRLADRVERERGRITHVITDYILKDADFDNTNDLRLEAAALKHWPEYERYLRDNASEEDFLFYKFAQGLRHLHDTNARYFETIEFDAASGYKVVTYTTEAQYAHFIALVQGFASHWKLLSDEAARQKRADQFQTAVKNTRLSRQLFAGAPYVRRDTRHHP